ncbi:MAG: nitroreductase family deazaflavin-dependent oxidoreductase [Anaerolineales bacterium]|jgi:deazaflavin-dependent oxidoreductase (nitroreductase family)
MELSPEAESRLRRGFRLLNKFMLILWRLGLARYGNPTRFGGAIMVIKHMGRKTGRIRFAPVNYYETDRYVYCTAGFGRKTHWYRNLIANPQVELWLPDSRWEGFAEDFSDAQDRIALLRHVLIASGFASRLFGMNPRRMDDAAIDCLFDSYRLVRIRKVAPLTGPGGPGDLVWVWPILVVALLMILARKRSLRGRR